MWMIGEAVGEGAMSASMREHSADRTHVLLQHVPQYVDVQGRDLEECWDRRNENEQGTMTTHE